MGFYLCFLFDVTLLVLGTLRLIRLVKSDELFESLRLAVDNWVEDAEDDTEVYTKRAFWYAGLICAFCMGYWVGVLTLVSLAVAGGPGDAAEWWRWAIAPFALNYVTGHVSTTRD